MRKTDKKRDNALRQALTEFCDWALDNIPGFCWVTHLVDYQRYPASLRIICVFNTDADLAKAKGEQESEESITVLCDALSKTLKTAQIVLPAPTQHIFFDTEESCERQHDGDWATRLARRP